MYRKHHNGQLSIEEFHVPFGGMLDPENRWVLFATLMHSDEIEEAYAPQFSPTNVATAKLNAWRLALVEQLVGPAQLADDLPRVVAFAFHGASPGQLWQIGKLL
jgi:hypothetical protein